MKRIVIIITFALILNNIVYGQDIQLSQFYASQTYLNPAFTGANVCSRFSMVYRSQWPGVKTAYKSYLASYDHFIGSKNLGMGINFGEDHAGSGALKTTIINPLIAYELRFSYSKVLRFGIQPGFGIKSIDFNRLRFGDQIYRGGEVATVELIPEPKRYFDVGTGVLFGSADYWMGVSAFHINKPMDSFYDDPEAIIPVKWSVHGGKRFLLNKDESYESEKRYITALMHYRHQNRFDQLDIGFYYTKKIFNIGIWYRGIPLLKAYKKGYQNNDAMSFIWGVSVDRLNIGYSYDFTISKLTTRTLGSHEITLSYQMCKPSKVKKGRNKRIVYCPKF